MPRDWPRPPSPRPLHGSIEAELQCLVSSLPCVSPEAIQLACLWHVCDEHIASRCSPDLTALRVLQGRCVMTYASVAGVSVVDVVSASEALQRVQTTYGYLRSLPD